MDRDEMEREIIEMWRRREERERLDRIHEQQQERIPEGYRSPRILPRPGNSNIVN